MQKFNREKKQILSLPESIPLNCLLPNSLLRRRPLGSSRGGGILRDEPKERLRRRLLTELPQIFTKFTSKISWGWRLKKLRLKYYSKFEVVNSGL